MAKENERTVMGMAEYIDRKALREAFDNADADIVEEYGDGDCDWGFGRKNVLEVINSVPAADVAPVRPGRWLSWGELHGGNTPAKNVFGVFCSECVRQSDSKTHFCPNCGAKMDLEEPNEAKESRQP